MDYNQTADFMVNNGRQITYSVLCIGLTFSVFGFYFWLNCVRHALSHEFENKELWLFALFGSALGTPVFMILVAFMFYFKVMRN